MRAAHVSPVRPRARVARAKYSSRQSAVAVALPQWRVPQPSSKRAWRDAIQSVKPSSPRVAWHGSCASRVTNHEEPLRGSAATRYSVARPIRLRSTSLMGIDAPQPLEQFFWVSR